MDAFDPNAGARDDRVGTLLLALGLPLLTLIGAHLLFTPMYRSNDDIHMDLLTRGVGVASQPDPYIIFSNILLGRLCAWLYGLLPGIAWYRLIQLAVQYTASVVLVFALLRRGPSLSRVLLVVAYLVTFDLAFYVHPQFTLTAALPAMAAVLVWHDRTRGGGFSGPLPWATFLLLFAISGLIRYESTLMVLAVALPVVALGAVRVWTTAPATRRLGATLRGALVPYAAGVLIVAGLALYDLGAVRGTPGWEQFHEYTWLRAEFIDFSHVAYDEETRPLFEQVGWSENDYEMLRSWFFADREVYDIDNLRTIVHGLPPDHAGLPQERGRHLAELVGDAHFLPMLGAALLPLLFVPFGSAGYRSIGLTLLAAIAASSSLLLVFQQLQPRLVQPMLAFVCLVGIAAAEPRGSRELLRGRTVPALILLLACVASTVARLQQHSTTAQARNAQLVDSIRALSPQPHQLYVVWGQHFPYELLSPLSDLDELRDFNLLALGTHTTSPSTRARLREFGVDDLYRALYRRDDVFLIGLDSLNRRFVRFVREHHGETIRAVKVADFGGAGYRLFAVYRFAGVGTEDAGN